ncbi:hypothetical protein DFP93_1092 [Aneurinibacillus soli]|uniref:Uncharacterized protein n=1 Tax=Aneurinibacillus soli TaxID=1500254 RepID=A0A0U5BAF2_9BACL|nr:hypothetical protein [Aneurinibacillus soli]PYE61303.1 hypothetical protein DFP93_1092 [Aneurinibacillus soli]BAU27868.1 hypothetical protein CB4_02042 [Aneurinibacillus soli]
MKKRVGLMGILLMFALAATGCGNATEQGTATSAQGQGAASTNSDQKPQGKFSRPDLMGEVESIVGNEVKLKLIEIPQRTGSGAQGQHSSSGQGGQGGGNTSGTGQARTVKYTGQTETVTIPVGVPLIAMSRGDNGLEETEVELKSIKKGSILSITYADKTAKTISRVTIRTPRQSGQ